MLTHHPAGWALRRHHSCLVCFSGSISFTAERVLSEQRSYWMAHFSNRPGKLFEGAQSRLTVVVFGGKVDSPILYSSQYYRWNAREGEREHLFSNIRYVALGHDLSVFHDVVPKVGSVLGLSVLQKIQASGTVKDLMQEAGKCLVYWVRVPGYFCQFFLEPPMARPEGGGPARERGELNSIHVSNETTQRLLHAVLNSTTYYYFYVTHTDGRHINPSDVQGFPMSLEGFSREATQSLVALSKKLEVCMAKNTSHWRKSGLLIDSADSKACKPIIDDIDRALAAHYGFSDEELDFIINYDIKYRMGRGTGGDEEE